MLILTRRPNERLMIGKDIIVEVLEIRGNQVRLGIKAPAEVKVLREEILVRQAAAAQPAAKPAYQPPNR